MAPVSSEQFQQSLIPVPTHPSSYRGEKQIAERTRGGSRLYPHQWGITESAHPVRFLAPGGYYDQQHSHQEVLPGMEMTPQEHVDALAKKHALIGSIRTTPGEEGGQHHLTLYHPDPVIDRNGRTTDRHMPVAHLTWASKGGYGRENLSPGEIGMVHVDTDRRKSGVASDMLSTAEKIASEHDEISQPRHSDIRTDRGVKWSRAKMAERKEQVW
jgi:hypothetical protein